MATSRTSEHAVQAGISESERRRLLEAVDKLAWWMDSRFLIPGTSMRVGLDGIIGLIPGIGDTATAALGLFLFYAAIRLGVPLSGLARMLGNWGVDWLVGLVPVAGDVFDIGFKAHRRNARIIHDHVGDSRTG